MNSLFSSIQQLHITCDAPDEFQQKVIGWDIDHLQLAPGNYRVNIDMVHTPNIQFSNVTHYVGVHERGCIPPGAYAISLPPLLGTNPLSYCGGILERDECVVLMAGEEFETISYGGVNYLTIVVDTDVLNREAVLLTGHPFASLVRSQRMLINKQDRFRLRQTIFTMMQELKKNPHHLLIERHELLEKHVVQLLLLSLQSASGKKIKIPNRRQMALKAEQLMRQNLKQQKSINQLCRHIGCSARTLHLGFKERYGIAPGKYGRILALNAVHHKLCHAQQRDNVSEIAMAWGFYHLGRFSQQYKQLFKELPSDTMKRNR